MNTVQVEQSVSAALTKIIASPAVFVLAGAVLVVLLAVVFRGKDRNRSSWPTWLVVIAVGFVAFPMVLTVPDPLRPFRLVAIGVVLTRWAYAVVRRERSWSWIVYIVLLVAVPLLVPPLANMVAGKH